MVSEDSSSSAAMAFFRSAIASPAIWHAKLAQPTAPSRRTCARKSSDDLGIAVYFSSSMSRASSADNVLLHGGPTPEPRVMGRARFVATDK